MHEKNLCTNEYKQAVVLSLHYATWTLLKCFLKNHISCVSAWALVISIKCSHPAISSRSSSDSRYLQPSVPVVLPSLMLVIRDTRGINREEWEMPPEIIIRVKPLYSNDRAPASHLFYEVVRMRNKKQAPSETERRYLYLPLIPD